MSSEVKTAGKEDREKLIEELIEELKKTPGCFQVKFSVIETLGIHSVLMIPLNKLRIMRR